MFDISALKEMKLSELQEIAKLAKTIKFNGVKKETLISQILAHQEATVAPPVRPVAEAEIVDEKPKRARIVPAKKTAVNKNAPVLEFDKAEEAPEKAETPIAVTKTPAIKANPKTNPKIKGNAAAKETAEVKSVETIPEVQENIENTESTENTEDAAIEKKGPKIVKFSKSAYEKKVALKKEKEATKDVVPENEVVAEVATVEKTEAPVQTKKINP
jgi:transcription termination factor Rho